MNWLQLESLLLSRFIFGLLYEAVAEGLTFSVYMPTIGIRHMPLYKFVLIDRLKSCSFSALTLLVGSFDL